MHSVLWHNYSIIVTISFKVYMYKMYTCCASYLARNLNQYNLLLHNYIATSKFIHLEVAYQQRV